MHEGRERDTFDQQRKSVLARFDQIRRLIEVGRIEDFLFVGRDMESRHFLTEVVQQPSNRSELFAFVGVIDSLKLELTEQAQLAPSVLPDGTVLDPYQKETYQ